MQLRSDLKPLKLRTGARSHALASKKATKKKCKAHLMASVLFGFVGFGVWG